MARFWSCIIWLRRSACRSSSVRDIHGLVDAQTGHTVISEQSTPMSGHQGAFTHAGGYFGLGVRASVINPG